MMSVQKSVQEATLYQRAQCIRRAQLLYLMTFIGRQSTYQQLINHIYVTGHKSYRIPQNSAKLWPLRRSRSFMVTDFGANQKAIYDFLLVINTNLPPILHRFQVTADYMSNFH